MLKVVLRSPTLGELWFKLEVLGHLPWAKKIKETGNAWPERRPAFIFCWCALVTHGPNRLISDPIVWSFGRFLRSNYFSAKFVDFDLKWSHLWATKVSKTGHKGS